MVCVPGLPAPAHVWQSVCWVWGHGHSTQTPPFWPALAAMLSAPRPTAHPPQPATPPLIMTEGRIQWVGAAVAEPHSMDPRASSPWPSAGPAPHPKAALPKFPLAPQVELARQIRQCRSSRRVSPGDCLVSLRPCSAAALPTQPARGRSAPRVDIPPRTAGPGRSLELEILNQFHRSECVAWEQSEDC